jgi:N-[(2S)-2-amino-2-carboxyethyl]-L-glutamate dehydrogenase
LKEEFSVMIDDNILILTGYDILSVLTGRETEVLRTVQHAYEAHAKGCSSLPHSTFLHFPDHPANRIIALPAFLGDEFQVAGIKWIASFPENRDARLDRASAVLILNSTHTGRPEAIMEGSIISAKRTAASAALGARCLHHVKGEYNIGLIGCGLINLEIARFLLADRPQRRRFLVFDISQERAQQFKTKAEELLRDVEIDIVHDVNSVLKECSLLSLATTAIEPHISDLSCCRPGTTVLHISLRDLTPDAILSCENIVDDISHVCRARTSVHLAELQAGNREFIRCTLADLLMDTSARLAPQTNVIFSPFGLGILDLAVGKLVYGLAKEEGRGRIIDSFLPAPWIETQGSTMSLETRLPETKAGV